MSVDTGLEVRISPNEIGYVGQQREVVVATTGDLGVNDVLLSIASGQATLGTKTLRGPNLIVAPITFDGSGLVRVQAQVSGNTTIQDTAEVTVQDSSVTILSPFPGERIDGPGPDSFSSVSDPRKIIAQVTSGTPQARIVNNETGLRWGEDLTMTLSGTQWSAPLDPNAMPNGSYTIVVATDLDQNNIHSTSCSTCDSVVVEIDTAFKLGNFEISFVDLQIPVGGIPLTITRSYDSLRKDTVGDFGLGWNLDIGRADVTVSHPDGQPDSANQSFVAGSRLTFTLPGGRQESFEFTPQFRNQAVGQVITEHIDPVFVNVDPLSRATLTVVQSDDISSGANDDYITSAGVAYNPLLQASEFQVATQTGFTFHVENRGTNANPDFQVTKIVNREGNELRFGEEDANFETVIESSLGPAVTIKRESAGGKITRIFDASNPGTDETQTGTFIKYVYNGDKLQSVVNRVAQTTTFVYHRRQFPQVHQLWPARRSWNRSPTATAGWTC